MATSWDQYTGLYYGLQGGSLLVIFFLIRIFIPHDLINWILEAVFFMKNDNGAYTPTIAEETSGCICRDIWKVFRKFFKCNRYQDYSCCGVLKSGWTWLENNCHCTNCFRSNDDLKNKQLPHHHPVKMRRENAEWYCGYFIHINLSKFGVYSLLCISVWCASVAFFEAIILSYSVVGNGDTKCPTPKRATAAAEVNCFAYTNSFDSSPANRSFPDVCNGTSRLTFVGDWAGCYAWILMNVEVVDVIEELGICSGIIAFLGGTVTIMSFLCRQHRWRIIYDTLACLSIASIPILIKYQGAVPFLTYVLLVSLFCIIHITQFLLGFVPLLTVICVINMAFKSIKDCFKPNTQSAVTPFIE